jgi:hypothetical protein
MIKEMVCIGLRLAGANSNIYVADGSGVITEKIEGQGNSRRELISIHRSWGRGPLPSSPLPVCAAVGVRLDTSAPAGDPDPYPLAFQTESNGHHQKPVGQQVLTSIYKKNGLLQVLMGILTSTHVRKSIYICIYQFTFGARLNSRHNQIFGDGNLSTSKDLYLAGAYLNPSASQYVVKLLTLLTVVSYPAYTKSDLFCVDDPS